MKIILFVFLVLTLHTGCKNSNRHEAIVENSSLVHVKMHPPDEDALEDLYLSEIADSVRYTQLQTPKPIDFFLYCDTKEFIPIISSGSIQLFGNDGKFIRQIGSVGRGHGEYMQPLWTVGEQSKEVYVFSYKTAPYTLLVYGFDGKFKRKIANKAIHPASRDFTCVGDRIVFTIPPTRSDGDLFSPEVILFDPIQNREVDSIPDYHRLQFKNDYTGNYSYPIVARASYGDSLYYLSAFSDTLYRITPNKIVPLVVFDYGKYKYDASLITMSNSQQYNKAAMKKVKPLSMLAEKDALYIQFGYIDSPETQRWILKLDLKSGRTQSYKPMFVNDVDHGPDYSIPYFNKSIVFDAALIVSDPDQLKEYLSKDPTGKSAFTRLLRKSTENSNSIIMQPYLK